MIVVKLFLLVTNFTNKTKNDELTDFLALIYEHKTAIVVSTTSCSSETLCECLLTQFYVVLAVQQQLRIDKLSDMGGTESFVWENEGTNNVSYVEISWLDVQLADWSQTAKWN